MTQKELEQELKKMEEFRLRLSKEPELREEFIRKTGIWTPTGKLRKPYR